MIGHMTDADEISVFTAEFGVRAIRLHGDVETERLRRLKSLHSDPYVLKSLVAKEDNAEELPALVDEVAEYGDMFITDTLDPATGAKGATGLTHDRSVSAEPAASA